jgi:acetyl esterase/lipase
VAWVREHAPDLGVDPRLIGAIGFSAGGHLAAMLAVEGHGSRESGSRIRAAASWSGPLGLPGAIAYAAPEGRSVVEWQIEQFVGCGGEPSCQDRIREASPTTYIDSTDAALFIASSTQETLPFEQAKDMAQTLGAQSVPVRLVAVPGSLHAEQFADVHVSTSGPTVLDASVRFLRTWLHRDRPGDALPGSGSAGWIRAVSVLGLALVAVAAALVVRRRHASRGAASPPQWEPYEVDPAGIARTDALSRAGATQAEIAARLAAEGYRKSIHRRATTR